MLGLPHPSWLQCVLWPLVLGLFSQATVRAGGSGCEATRSRWMHQPPSATSEGVVVVMDGQSFNYLALHAMYAHLSPAYHSAASISPGRPANPIGGYPSALPVSIPGWHKSGSRQLESSLSCSTVGLLTVLGRCTYVCTDTCSALAISAQLCITVHVRSA